MLEVSVYPLFTQHCDKCSQQRHEQTCVEEIRSCDDLCGGTIPRWGKSRVLVGSNGFVETEENRTEIGFGPFAGAWLELGLDVDDKGGADRREQTGLKMWSGRYNDKKNAETDEDQGGVEIIIVLLHAPVIVLIRLLFVHGVEVELGIIVFNGFEVHPQSLLDAVISGQSAGPRN